MINERLELWAKLGGAGIAAWVGMMPTLAWILLSLMILDVLSGIGRAYITQTVSSEVSGPGIARKMMMLLGVLATALLQSVIGIDRAADAMMGFLILHEGISIAENLAASGVPLPRWLVDALAKVKDITS